MNYVLTREREREEKRAKYDQQSRFKTKHIQIIASQNVHKDEDT